MAGLCEGGNEPSGSLKAICKLTLSALCLQMSSKLTLRRRHSNRLNNPLTSFVSRPSHLERISEAILRRQYRRANKGFPMSRASEGITSQGFYLNPMQWKIKPRSTWHYLQHKTGSSQFTARLPRLVLLAQSLEFTVSRTPDLQRQSTELRTQVPQLRSIALKLRTSGDSPMARTLTLLRTHSSRIPVSKLASLLHTACCPKTSNDCNCN
ncbi:hypothetical protein ANN_07987 [Periplaneta americana]|uniref:Uncharacterized protein n=1 Tax=Periplaneta americana TaxID=6978 RepID=A0ABQ8T071_PERAM|nr:hypothetical protein ANN_07987 [Periplaneta americana]